MASRAKDPDSHSPQGPRRMTPRRTGPRDPIPSPLLAPQPSNAPPASGFTIPNSHHLIVTTTSGVYAWTSEGVNEIFKSASGGIVAAKTTNGKILAVADSQLVFLHDITGGMQQSYRLKSQQGQVKMLYFDYESDRLYFTTSLQHSVQCYSLFKGKLLGSAPAHGSPVTVFALSPEIDVLISASKNPPTLLITHLRENRLPIMLQPDCSMTHVVAAAFHPARGNVFVLAFADGTVGVYDMLRLLSSNLPQGIGKAYGGTRGEVANIHSLHVSTTDISWGEDESSVGDLRSSVNAIAFIPKRRCTTVSVGSDGKVCIVNFDKRGARKGIAQLTQSWHINGVATSLSILQRSSEEDLQLHEDLSHDDQAHEKPIIAVGREDGWLMLYDVSGRLLANEKIGREGKILGIEWTGGHHHHHPDLEHRKAIANAKIALQANFKPKEIIIPPLHYSKSRPIGPRALPDVPNSAPVVPPRPIPKPDGKSARRRAETAGEKASEAYLVERRATTWDERPREVDLPDDDPFGGKSPTKKGKQKARRVKSASSISPSEKIGIFDKKHRPKEFPARSDSLNRTPSTSTADDYQIVWDDSQVLGPYGRYPVAPVSKQPPVPTHEPDQNPRSEPTLIHKAQTGSAQKPVTPSVGPSWIPPSPLRAPVPPAINSMNSTITSPEHRPSSSDSERSSDIIPDWHSSTQSPLKPDPLSPRTPVVLGSPEKKTLFSSGKPVSAVSPKKKPQPPHKPAAMQTPEGHRPELSDPKTPAKHSHVAEPEPLVSAHTTSFPPGGFAPVVYTRDFAHEAPLPVAPEAPARAAPEAPTKADVTLRDVMRLLVELKKGQDNLREETARGFTELKDELQRTRKAR